MQKGGRWPLAFDAALIPFQGYLDGFLIFVKKQRCTKLLRSKVTKERKEIKQERQPKKH